jgi:hypothetical protein
MRLRRYRVPASTVLRASVPSTRTVSRAFGTSACRTGARKTTPIEFHNTTGAPLDLPAGLDYINVTSLIVAHPRR